MVTIMLLAFLQAAPCTARVYIAEFVPPAELHRNSVPSDRAQKWLDKDAKKKYPGICVVTDPAEATHAILWTSSVYNYTSTITLPTIQTTEGKIRGRVGNKPISGRYEETTVGTRQQTTQSSALAVTVWLYAMPAVMPGQIPLMKTSKGGSKPDKSAIEDVFKKLSH